MDIPKNIYTIDEAPPEGAFFPVLRSILWGARLRQLLVAILCFVLPLALLPLARARDTAVSWERVETWPGDRVVRHVVVSSSGDREVLYAVGAVSGLYMSTDGGREWSRADLPLPRSRLGVVQIVDLAVDPNDPNKVYVAVATSPKRPRPTLYWTEDGGLSWGVRSTLGPSFVEKIAFDPSGDDLYMITAGHILRAFVFDRGHRYFARDEDDLHSNRVGSIDNTAQVTAFAVSGQHKPPQLKGARWSLILYVGTFGKGLRVLVDDPMRGPWWVPVEKDLVSRYVRERATIYAICIHPQQPNIVCVGTDEGIYASPDGGLSWLRTAYPLRLQKVLSVLIDPLAKELYAGVAGGGVLHSKDNGVNWQPVAEGLGRASAFSLAITETGTRALYVGTDSGLWRLPLSRD